MSKKKDYNMLNDKQVEKLPEQGASVKAGKKVVKSLVLKVAIAIAVILLITTGTIYTTAIFTSQTSESIVATFTTLNFETEVSASGVERSSSQNVKYVANYYNDSADSMLDSAKVTLAANSLPAYVRVQAQYAFTGVADSALTENLKTVISHLNANAVSPYNTNGAYIWTENASDGYYYLTDTNGKPLAISGGASYTFIEQSNPIKYNAVSPLSLNFTTGEEQTMRSLALALNFECTQVAAEYATVAELKLNSPDFGTSTTQAKTFGNVLSFDTDGGDPMPAVRTNSNTLNLSSYVPTKEGYTFASWMLNTTIVSSVSFSTSKTVQVKAKWLARAYNITYKDKGNNDYSGSTITAPLTYSYGTETALPQAPTKVGYTFLGWFKDSSCNQAISVIPATQVGDITVYAKWVANSLRVIYENMQGAVFTSDATSTFDYGSNTSITLPNVYKNGYAFDGWYLNADGSGDRVTYLTTSAYTDNVTLYARFLEIPYQITFSANGGEVVGGNLSTLPSVAYSATTSFTLPGADSVTKSGYTLVGWQVVAAPTDSNWQTNAVYMAGETYTQNPYKYRYGDVQMQAMWKIDLNQATLKLMADGTQKASYTISIGENVVLPLDLNKTTNAAIASSLTDIVPQKTNSVFLGWSLTAASTTAEYTNAYLSKAEDVNSSTNTITLHAIYKPVAYYAITNNASTSSYSVYAVTSSGDIAFLFATNNYELCFTGASKHCAQAQITFHFGNSISAGAVIGTLNTGSDCVRFSADASFDTSLTTINFANGSIRSTRPSLNKTKSNTAMNDYLYRVSGNKVLNLGTNDSNYKLEFYAQSVAFTAYNGEIHVNGGYYQIGTSDSRVTNFNGLFTCTQDTRSILEINDGTFVYWSNFTTSDTQYHGIVYSDTGLTTVNGGNFICPQSGVALYVLNARMVVNGGNFYSNTEGNTETFNSATNLLRNVNGNLTINNGYFSAYGRLLYTSGGSDTTTINGGSFYTLNGRDEITVTDGSLTINGGYIEVNNQASNCGAIWVNTNGKLYVHGGEIISKGSGPAILANKAGIRITIDGNAKIVSENDRALYLSGSSDVVEVGGHAEILSKAYQAVRKTSDGTLTIKDYAILISTDSVAETLYINNGIVNITGACQIINKNLEFADRDAVYTTATGKLHIYKDSSMTYGTTDYIDGQYINIVAYSKADSSQAMDLRAIDGENPCFVVDDGNGSKYLRVHSYHNAIALRTGTKSIISDGLFTSDLECVMYINGDTPINVTINGHAQIMRYKNSSSTPEIVNSNTFDKAVAIEINQGTTVNLTISGNAVIRSYDFSAIFAETGTVGANNTILSIGGNAQVISDNDSAITFMQTGNDARIQLYQNPVIQTNNDSKAHITFAKTNQIFARNGAAGSVLSTTNNTSGTEHVIRLHYVGETALQSGDVIVSNLESGRRNNFSITNPDVFLVYKSADKTLVVGRQSFVFYDANGGTTTIVDNTEHQQGETVNVIFSPTPTRDGYAFLGWSTQKFTTTPMYEADNVKTFIMPATSVTLYAVWKLQYVKLWYGNATSSATFHYSIDDALQAINRNGTSGSPTTQTSATIELLKSNLSLSQTYMFADVPSSVQDVYAHTFTNYKQVTHPNVKTINFTATLSGTTPNYVLNLYASNNAFILGSGYNITFSNLIIDGGAESQAREQSGRLAYITTNNASVTLGANTITQNFSVVSTDPTFDTSLTDYNNFYYGFGHGAYGGLIYNITGTVNINGNAIVQKCSVVYRPSAALVNSLETDNRIGIFAAGSVINSHGGTINVAKDAYIDSCETRFEGSYNSGTLRAWIDMYGAINMWNGTVNMHGRMSHCDIIARNTYTRTHVTNNEFDKIHARGAAIAMSGASSGARGTLNMGSSSDSTIHPSITNCYCSVQTYFGYILGVAIHAYNYSYLNIYNTTFDDLDGTGSNWLMGQSSGGAVYADNNNVRPTLVNCTVTNAHVLYGSALYGAGYWNVTGCTFTSDYGSVITFSSSRATNVTNTTITTRSKITNQEGTCIFAANSQSGALTISGCNLTSHIGPALYIGTSTGVNVFNTTVINTTMTSASGNGTIWSYGRGTLAIQGTSSITNSGGAAVRLEGGAHVNYLNGTGAEATPRLVFSMEGGTLQSTISSASCTLYCNNVGLVQVTGGTIGGATNNYGEAIYLNGGYNNADYQKLLRLKITGGTIQSQYTGNQAHARALYSHTNFYGRVEITGGTLYNKNANTQTVCAEGVAAYAEANDAARKAFTNAKGLFTIGGTALIQNGHAGYAIGAYATPVCVDGATIKTNQGGAFFLGSNNSCVYVKNTTFVTNDNQTNSYGFIFTTNTGSTNQYLYIDNGTMPVATALINVQGAGSTHRYIQIAGGTFTGGASSTAAGYIRLNQATDLTITGGTFGSTSTSTTYSEANTIKSREIIAVAAASTINITGGTFNAKEIFLSHTASVTSSINIAGNAKILNFNQLAAGTALDASNFNATFMLTAGSPTVSVYGSAQITAVTSSLFYAHVNTAKVYVYGTASTIVQSSGTYYWYRSPVTDATTMLYLANSPLISSPNGTWISLAGTSKISVKLNTVVLNKYDSNASSNNSKVIKISKDNPAAGQIMVINCETESGYTNQDRFVITNLGYYLQYTNNTLVIQKQTVEFVYNRNFMMKKRGSATDTSIVNVGNFGATGNNFTEVYYVANTTHAYVEGKSATGMNVLNGGTLTKNGFARVGFTYSGWKVGTSSQTLANQASITFTTSATVGQISINGTTHTATEAWDSDVRSFRSVATQSANIAKFQIRLYAQWTEETYTVTLDTTNTGATITGQGASVSLTGKKYGDTINLASYTATKTGYAFVGWAETRTIDGKEYVRIFYQDPYNTTTGTNAVGTFIGMSLTNSAASNYNPNVYSFSNIKATDNIRRSVNSSTTIPSLYTYYLEYPKTNITINWTQTENPTTAATNAAVGHVITGSTSPINNFQGLRQCNNQAYLKGRTGDWYYSIGLVSGSYFNGEIPTYNSSSAKTYGDGWTTTLDATSFPVSLWQMIGDGTTANISAFTEGGASVGITGNYYVKGAVTLKPLFKEVVYSLATKGSTGAYSTKVQTNSLDDINAYLDAPNSADVTALLTVHRSVTENRAFRTFKKVSNLTTLNIQGETSSVVWTIPYTSNFMGIGEDITGAGTTAYVNIDNIKITQGRNGSGTATTGRFVHVHPTGQLTLGANLEVYNCASTWSASFAWVEGIVNITSGTYHDNYSASNGGVIGISNYASTTVDRTSTISNGTFYNNTSANGGVVFATNNSARHVILTINGGTFRNNTAANNGGAIFLDGKSATISGGSFYANSAVNGGAIYHNNGTTTMTGGSIGGDGTAANANVATSHGAALYQAGGTITISGGTIGKANYGASTTQYANKAVYGAIANIGGTMTISGSTVIAGNYASSWGGGILNDPSGTLNLNGGSMYGNFASTGGGGAHFKGTVTINGMTIGNDSYPNGSPRGGAFATLGGTTTLNSGTIGSTTTALATSSNRANYSTGCAGAIDAYGGNFVMTGGTIGHNYAASHGGAIRCNKTCTISGGNIQYNYAASTADGQGGGAIIVCEASVLTISGSANIHHNQTACSGGAIHFWNNCTGTSTISGGTIHDNTAAVNGGGINIEKSTLNITGGSIYSNTASNGNGGGINIRANSTVNITGGSIYANNASANGGGVHLLESTSALTINGGTNASTPAVIIGATTTSTANNGAKSNVAANGGGIYIANGTFKIYGNVLVGYNYASSTGGGIRINGGTIAFNDGATTPTHFTGNIQYNAAASNGGGMWSQVALSLSTGKVHHNKAGQTDGSSTANAHGGGLYFQGGTNKTFTLTGDVEVYNNASYRAGGVAAPNVVLNVNSDNVKIYSNTSTNIGGGIGSWNVGTINLSAGKVYSNSASSGGGVWCQSASTLNLSGTAEIYSNTSTNGGGVFLEIWTNAQEMPNMNMSGGKIYSNTAAGNGGGILFGNARKDADNPIRYSTLTITGGVIGDDTKTATATASAYSNKAYNGGGIYCQGGNISITNGMIAYNYAVTGGGGLVLTNNNGVVGTQTFGGTNHIQYNFSGNYGGGVGVFNGAATLNASMLIHNNGATRGGGVSVHNTAALTISGADIYSNNGSTCGGGMQIYNTATVTFSSGKIRSNTSGGGGGVCANGANTFNLSGTAEIYGNSTTGWGGGIYLEPTGTTQPTLNMSGGNIYNNSAAYGGGIYVAHTKNGSTVVRATANITGGVIGDTTTTTATDATYSNRATSNGGGIWCGGGTLILTNATIGHNYAAGVGGGIVFTTPNYASGTATSTANASYSFTGTDNIQYNYAEGANGGGGIYADFAMTFNGSLKIHHNKGPRGGGMYILNSTHVISGAEISYNEATVYGGGIYNNNALTFNSGSVHHNTAPTGAGINYNASNSNSSITGGSFYSNTATSNGGAINFSSTGTLTITGGTFGVANAKATSASFSNKAAKGGAIYISAGSVTINNASVVIADNYATTTGGAIHTATSGTVTLSAGTIYGNYSPSGGGVYQAAGAFNMSGGAIASNTATNYGGGVAINAGTFTMSGGCIGKSDATAIASTSAYSNRAQGGGGVYVDSGASFTMNNANAKIYYNYASAFDNSSSSANPYTNGGGGIYCLGTFTMSAGNIAYNRATGGGGVHLRGTSSAAKTSTISGGSIFSNIGSTDGGGIYVGLYATLNMSGGCVGKADATACATSTAYSNIAGYGGGVYVRGVFNMSGSAKIWYNYATTYGGGVEMQYNAGTNIPTSVVTMTMAGSASIQYNVVSKSDNTAIGGGVNLNTANCKLTMNAGSINYNECRITTTITSSATSNQYRDTRGAGVSVIGNSTFEMKGGTVSYNKGYSTMTADSTATYGAYPRVYGAGVDIASADSKFVMSGGTIGYNEAYANVTNNGTATSRSYVYGAGVRSYGLVTITAGTITDNKADAVLTNGGSATTTAECRCAGLFLHGNAAARVNSISGATISNNTITNGTTRDGGGVMLMDTNTTATITNTTISGNSAYYGAGIYVYQSKLTLGANVNINGNTATGNSSSRGGGIAINGNSGNIGTVTINNATCKIYGNTATNAGGGVANLTAYATLNMSAGVIGDATKTAQATASAYSNKADYGGGLYINNGTVNLSGTAIIAYNSGTRASTVTGGNIRQDNGTLNISGNVEIRYGFSTYTNGSAISFTNGTINMSGGTITQTSYNCIEQSNGTFNMSGGSISNTKADGTYGTVYTYAGTFIMTGGTITNNSTTTGYAYTTRSANAHIRGGTLESKATSGATMSIYNQATARINLSGSPSLKSASGYHIYTPFESSVVASSNNVPFTLNNGDTEANGRRCVVNFAHATPALNQIVVTSVESAVIASHFGVVVSNANTGFAFMAIFGGTSGTYANTIYLISSGYSTSNTATATGLHYLGWLPSGASDANLNPHWNHNKTTTQSADISVTQKSFVWTLISSNFIDIINAYRAMITENTYSRAYIASDTSSAYTLPSAVTFGASSVKNVDWFALNLRKNQTFTNSTITNASMFTVASGYTVNVYRIEIHGNNKTSVTGLTSAGIVNVSDRFNITLCTNSGVVVTGGTLISQSGSNNDRLRLNLNSTSTNGGGMKITGGTVTLITGAVVQNNSATNYGGGIYISGGTLNLSGGVFIGVEDFEVDDYHPTMPTNNDNMARYGGGIAQQGGTIYLSALDSYKPYIAGNLAVDSGGGILSDNGTLNINAADIGYNSAQNNAGGIWSNHTITFGTGSINIYENYAGITNSNGCGGGIYLENSSNTTTLNNANIQICNNNAWRGGGIAVYTGAILKVQNAKIYGNTCTKHADYWYYGGGIFASQAGSASAYGLEISGGDIYNNTASAGGGVAAYNCKVKISGGNIYNNTANGRDDVQSIGRGGGIFMEAFYNQDSVNYGSGVISILDMTGGLVYGNTVVMNPDFPSTGSNYGGGVWVGATTYNNTVYRTIFNFSGGRIGGDGTPAQANKVVNGAGGGVGCDGIMNMSGSAVVGSITETTATASSYANMAKWGGGIDIGPPGTLNITGGTVGRNYTTNDSAGIRSNGTIIMSGGSVQRNFVGSVGTGSGGGIMLHQGGNMTMNGGNIIYNQATTWGGGIGMWNNTTGTLTLNKGTIDHNIAGGDGGGINIEAGTVNVYGCSVTNNSAHNGAGINNHGGTLNTYNWNAVYANAFEFSGSNVSFTGVVRWEYLYRPFPVVNGRSYTITVNIASRNFKSTGTYNYLPFAVGGELPNANTDWTNASGNTRWASGTTNITTTTGNNTTPITATLTFTAPSTCLAYFWFNFGAAADGQTSTFTFSSITCKENNVDVPYTFWQSGWNCVDVSYNTASEWAGGIFGWTGTTNIIGAHISYNTAVHGGGIAFHTTPATFRGAIIHHNTSTHDGGGIYVYCVEATLIDLLVYENTAIYGGGLSSYSNTQKYLYFHHSRFYSNTANDGGALYFEVQVVVQFNDHTIIGDSSKTTAASASSYSNKANYGAGIYLNNGATISSRYDDLDYTIAYNYAVYEAGGVYVTNNSYLYLTQGSIKYNYANGNGEHSGPAVRSWNNSLVYVSLCFTLKGNSGEGATYGGCNTWYWWHTESVRYPVAFGQLNVIWSNGWYDITQSGNNGNWRYRYEIWLKKSYDAMGTEYRVVYGANNQEAGWANLDDGGLNTGQYTDSRAYFQATAEISNFLYASWRREQASNIRDYRGDVNYALGRWGGERYVNFDYTISERNTNRSIYENHDGHCHLIFQMNVSVMYAGNESVHDVAWMDRQQDFYRTSIFV